MSNQQATKQTSAQQVQAAMRLAMDAYTKLASFDYWEDEGDRVTARSRDGDGAYMQLAYENGRIIARWGCDDDDGYDATFEGNLAEGNAKTLAFDLLDFLGD